MMRSKKMILGSIVGVALLALVYFGWSRPFYRGRIRLLYRTDHVALLAACREVMTNRHTFARDRDWHGTEGSDESFIDPNDPRIPAVISAIHPVDIIASDTRVEVAVSGGFDHYGVFALSEKETRNGTNIFSGPFELIPGLWYYDEGLMENDRNAWMRKLKGMKPHSVPNPKW